MVFHKSPIRQIYSQQLSPSQSERDIHQAITQQALPETKWKTMAQTLTKIHFKNEPTRRKYPQSRLCTNVPCLWVIILAITFTDIYFGIQLSQYPWLGERNKPFVPWVLGNRVWTEVWSGIMKRKWLLHFIGIKTNSQFQFSWSKTSSETNSDHLLG